MAVKCQPPVFWVLSIPKPLRVAVVSFLA